MRVLIFIICTLFFTSGCAYKKESNSILYKVKYIEIVENNILINCKLTMIPLFENKVKKFTTIKTKARAEKETDLSIWVSLWHNAIKNILVSEGEKHIYGKTEKGNKNINDYIEVSYEGFVLSPPNYSDVGYDSFYGEAYGTYKIKFSLSN